MANKTNKTEKDGWTYDQYGQISDKLQKYGCQYVKGRDEYILLKEVIKSNAGGHRNLTEVSKPRQTGYPGNPHKTYVFGSGVIYSIGNAIGRNDTDTDASYTGIAGNSRTSQSHNNAAFLEPLAMSSSRGIADVLPSFKSIQYDSLSLCIGFDTEFQDYRDSSGKHRRVLSLQMSIAIGKALVRYFFLVDPRYQEVTADGGLIPLKYCLSDILGDLRDSCFPDFPLVRKEKLVFKTIARKNADPIQVVDYKAMRDSVIPVTIICHTGKADISVFRRTKYDIDLFAGKMAEIQGGWMTTEDIRFRAEKDRNYNYYWLVNLTVRDTLGLTPADNRSLKALGRVINRPKIELSEGTIEHMSDYAVADPAGYYAYAMNDADIVVLFCAGLFRCNHKIPITLSSAAAYTMRGCIKDYFGVTKTSDFDRLYRGLEELDEGIHISADECLKFLKSTRYVPVRDNPDAKLVSEYFAEAYVGGFNASFYLGWITEQTTDFDLQNAYPTAMASIIDIDWSKLVRDFPRNYYLTRQDLMNPLIPAVAVGDFDFPDDCYCPNIPVRAKGGINIYPRHGRNVYMTGCDMYLALKLGARIKVFRGFTCQMLMKDDGNPSQCLAYAVSQLVQDRTKAKQLYKDNPLVEKSLKTMVCSCYGKIAQNVSPKSRYDAGARKHVSAKPSPVTSSYHAAYTTALVRCMLIGCINQLHDMGYMVYSVTTDGFITDAPTEVVRGLNAYGFSQIFQNGRYALNGHREDCGANQVWEPKHYNDVFLNIATRGNVAVNDEGVLAHNSYITGYEKDSRADRDAYIIAVLSREGRLKCPTKVWTQFAEIVERKHDFHVSETIRQLSMDFDYKRCPVVESAFDTPVHYDSLDGNYHVDTVIAEFDTRPFDDEAEFLNYRRAKESENCVKVKDDLERVKVKSSVKFSGYIGKNLDRKIILSILMGYRSGKYQIPALDGLAQKDVVNVVNSWDISPITITDWKNCSRSERQKNALPYETIKDTLNKILRY